MEKQHKTASMLAKKRKRKISRTVAASEPKNIKLKPDTSSIKPVPKKIKGAKAKVLEVDIPAKAVNNVELISANGPKKGSKKNKNSKVNKPPEIVKIEVPKPSDYEMESESKSSDNDNEAAKKSTKVQKKSKKGLSLSLEMQEKYPVLKDKELIAKFMKVHLSNNQKGRIRQAIRLSLKGSPLATFPDLIHTKLQNLLQATEFTDSLLRRIRILYNMLKVAIEQPGKLRQPVLGKKNKERKVKKEDSEKEDGKKEDSEKEDSEKEDSEKEDSEKEDSEKEEGGKKKGKVHQKENGPKKYIIFVGKLPLDINTEKLMDHFAEFKHSIKNVKVLPVIEGKRCTVAFIEMENEPSYELALSKNNTVIGNKLIKVEYAREQKGKGKKGAKGKSPKLSKKKSAKVDGKTPVKKRSHRRNIMKNAKAAENKE